MPKLLSIDTSTEACSTALYDSGSIIERLEIAPRQHNQKILTMVKEMLDEAGFLLSNLDAIAFGCGPGAFTGLRIAAGVVQGLAFSADLPIIPISTLAALAYGEQRQFGSNNILSAIDARMGEVYWGAYIYSDGKLELQANEFVCLPELVSIPVIFSNKINDWVGVGTGWHYASKLTQSIGHVFKHDSTRLPRAYDIACIGINELKHNNVLPAELAVPVYLRDNVVKKNT